MDVGFIGNWNDLTPAEQIQRTVQMNNSWSAEQAQKQMDFQREMSDTAHQREIADLKAAGLNPVLSAKLGGASTPSGAMGSTDTSGTSALLDFLTMSMETANSAARAAAGLAGNSGKDKGTSIFGLNPSDYKFKNARNAVQLGWNALMDLLQNSGADISMQDILDLAKNAGINLADLADGNSSKSGVLFGEGKYAVDKPDGPLKYIIESIYHGFNGNYKKYSEAQKAIADAYYKWKQSHSHTSGKF